MNFATIIDWNSFFSVIGGSTVVVTAVCWVLNKSPAGNQIIESCGNMNSTDTIKHILKQSLLKGNLQKNRKEAVV